MPNAALLEQVEVIRRSDQGSHQAQQDVLVVIPTYNEAGNVERIANAVLTVCSRADVLIVDDQSPDGTGRIAEELARDNPRIHLLHRRGRRGLGAAYMAGFRWALRRAYQRIIQMDADFSHDPAAIPMLLRHAEGYDLVIGSRYCGGGRTLGWPVRRQWLSFTANAYARTLLGGHISDMTGGYKCWRREVLERIDFARLRCDGYGFQVEMNHLAACGGFRIREVPITFRERRAGASKMSRGVAREAARHVGRLAWDRLLGRRHPALMTRSADEVTARHDGPAALKPRNVLVMCLGGIGDTVLSFAMLRQLRHRLPHARLTALAMWRQSAELLEDLGIFDEIRQHNFQTGSAWRSLGRLAELHRRRFDLSILAYPANRWEFNVAAWLVHAKCRIGHVYRDHGQWTDCRWLLTDRIAQGRRVHNVDENLRLLTILPRGVRTAPGVPDIRLGPLASKYHEFADALLGGIPGPYLGIHAGSSMAKNMAMKRWPAERFAELCRLVHAELGLTPLLFGTRDEADLNRGIASSCRRASVIATPSVRHTAAIMQRCSAFVSNDTALAHIACALDVPTVMIVGPTDPAVIGPCGDKVAVVSARVPCAPCYRARRASLTCRWATTQPCTASIPAATVRDTVADVLIPPRPAMVCRSDGLEDAVTGFPERPARATPSVCLSDAGTG